MASEQLPSYLRPIMERIKSDVIAWLEQRGIGTRFVSGGAVRGEIPVSALPAHASTHQNAGSDEISVAGLSGELADPQPPKTHASSHQNGGGDEISVAGLSGELADPQPPKLTVKETDGAPSVSNVSEIRVSNGKLTDVGGGVVSLDLSGDAGSSDASTVTYTPAVLTDWDGDADPGDVDNALDQLAERVDDLEGAGGGGAPTNADYWVETANAGLSAEVVVGTTGITTAAYASRQAAAKAGRLFLPNDGFYIERDTGAAWAPWGPVFPLTKPPALASFTWVNQGSATATEGGGAIFITTPALAGDSLKILKKAAPSAPYTLTVLIAVNMTNVNYSGCGILFRQSSDGKIHGFGVGSATFIIFSVKWPGPTSGGIGYTNYQIVHSQLHWLRIADDNTNRICSYSVDGQNWRTIHTTGRTDYLTADEIGFFVHANNATYGAAMTLLSWKEA